MSRSGSPPLPLPLRPEVGTRSAAHAAAAPDEIQFSDTASPPAYTRLDADARHAQAADGSDGGTGDSGLAAPPAADAPPRTCSQHFSDWFHYETVQVVRIRSKKAGIIHLVAQLLIVAYVVGWGLVWKKGYQSAAEGRGSSATKLKGVAYSNCSLPWLGPDAPAHFRVWDSYDLVSPVLEDNSLFVTTNMWVTSHQRRSRCVSYDSSNRCSNTTGGPFPMCATYGMTFEGRTIGPHRCLFNTTDPQQPYPTPPGGFCELFAWCPTERELPFSENHFRLRGVDNFTVFTRMTVRYPQFGAVLNNGEDALRPGLNYWTLGEIVQEAGYEWKDINTTGIIVAMESDWSCDLDAKDEDDCLPTIKFKRLDDPSSALSRGFNFRSAEMLHGATSGGRDLIKRYGFRLLVMMTGTATKFDAVALLTSIGAGIGLLAIATLIADVIATHLLPERAQYNSAKFQEVVIKDPRSRFLRTLTHALPLGGRRGRGDSSSDEDEGVSSEQHASWTDPAGAPQL